MRRSLCGHDPEVPGSVPDDTGLQRGPLSLVSINAELLERKVEAPV
jgi:hypothetical protein